MVEQAFDDQCTGANPRYPLMSEIKEMYLKRLLRHRRDEISKTEPTPSGLRLLRLEGELF